jgi:dTMP kinase
MTSPSRLITVEGVDGAGKTTLVTALAAELQARSVPVRVLREPGGVQASEQIRRLVKDPELTVGARTEALLYAAARAQLVEEALHPALDAGEWVLLDRFLDSSLAYQGAGRNLGVDAVRELNMFATGGIAPARTLLLMLEPAAARARTGGRDEAPDRLEREGDEFFLKIARAYRALAEAEPERIRVIDASLEPPQVLAQALAALDDLLPAR